MAYRALTGISFADGGRVEEGEIVPDERVEDWMLAKMANGGCIVEVDDDGNEVVAAVEVEAVEEVGEPTGEQVDESGVVEVEPDGTLSEPIDGDVEQSEAEGGDASPETETT